MQLCMGDPPTPSHLSHISKSHWVISVNRSVLEYALRFEVRLPDFFFPPRIVTRPCSPAAYERLECEWCRKPRTWATVIPQGYVIGVSVMMLRSLIYASLPVSVTVTDTFSHYSLWYGATKVGRGTSDPAASSGVPRPAHQINSK